MPSVFSECVRMPEKFRRTLSVGTAPAGAAFSIGAGASGGGGAGKGAGRAAADFGHNRSSRAARRRPRTGLVRMCVAPCR